ncbi:unnamed protein product [Pleuronectes platessa]|uniref:Uncharacterized protein n=1 Tax=Pleuronectes platessa TaxID=8262 RepID=A0A9N7VVU2_PLEPL|nr:unnamed protein product [Pleuronectes platessa]
MKTERVPKLEVLGFIWSIVQRPVRGGLVPPRKKKKKKKKKKRRMEVTLFLDPLTCFPGWQQVGFTGVSSTAAVDHRQPAEQLWDQSPEGRSTDEWRTSGSCISDQIPHFCRSGWVRTPDPEDTSGSRVRG